MAKAKLYKANLNWMVVGEGGEKIMGATPEAATEQFKSLWATHYPGVECPEIERDEAMDFVTTPEEKAAPGFIPPAGEVGGSPTSLTWPPNAPKEEAPEVPTHNLENKFTMEQLHAALTEGEKLQRAYAPSFAHPLLQAGRDSTYEEAVEAVRSLERGLSATTGREVKLL